MTRTGAYKALYFGTVTCGVLTLVASAVIGRPSLPLSLAVVLALLLPGRILGFFWRDLLGGLRLLRKKEFAKSRRLSEAFLADLEKRPWLKRLIWLGSGSYSRDPEAMALTNLGAAEVGLGEFEGARRHLERAMAIDPKNPLPFFNMGVLCVNAGTPAEAKAWFERAAALGYTGGVSDELVMAMQGRFAATDGRSQPPG